MTTLEMAFCGGCLSHQRDIPLNELFHRVLSRRLVEQYGIGVHPVISRDFTAAAPERVARLLQNGPDLLLLHVRSLPAVPNARWIAKEVIGTRARIRLNPRFFLVRWFPALQKFETEYGLRGTPGSESDDMTEGSYNRGSFANRMNVAAGLVVGVASAAIRETVEESLAALSIARQHGVPFFVLGPPPSTQAGRPGRAVCGRLNRAMRQASHTLGFPYVDLFPGWEDGHLMWDGLHLTPAGHRHVAERLRVEIGEGIAALGRAAARRRKALSA